MHKKGVAIMGDVPGRNKYKPPYKARKAIKANSESGEWYAVIDPVTGAVKYLRRKIKFKK